VLTRYFEIKAGEAAPGKPVPAAEGARVVRN
jgi:hypothetical protein